MNLINFHDNTTNKKYTSEIKIYLRGQGLKYSYFVEIFGNGLNTYIFIVKNNNKKYKIYFDEKHIIHWTTKIQYMEKENIEPHSHIDFCGYGKIQLYEDINYYKYGWFYSGDCDDYNNIYYMDFKFEIIKIKIKNDDKKIKIIKYITDENSFSDFIRYKNECIKETEIVNDINNIDNYNLACMKKINYNEWISNYDVDNKYYFMLDNLDKMVIPFQIINLTKKTEISNILFAAINYKNITYKINIKMTYNKNISEENDIYDIEIIFEIKNNDKDDIIIKNEDEEIYEFCYISTY